MALIVLLSLAFAPSAHGDSEAPPAAIRWSVPSHFGDRTDSLGRVVEDRPSEVKKGPWSIELRALGAACQDGARYRWSLRKAPIHPKRIGRCLFRTSVPREGPYRVGLVANAGGERVRLNRRIVVQDLLIVSIGDSVAAGEGVPDIPGVANAAWQSRRCHRSARAGTALAAKRIEQDDRHTSVTFVHLACSGATVPQGLTGPYGGVESNPAAAPLAAQVDVLNRLEKIRPVDAVLVSVGANDIHFGEVVRFCATAPPENCFTQPFNPQGPDGDNGQTAAEVVKESLADLPRRYRELDRKIDPSIPRSKIHIVEYFDPTGGSDGRICSHGPPGVSQAELEQAKTGMLAPLNAAIASAAEDLGWNEVGGVADLFRLHGYCAQQRWVMTLTRSLLELGGSPPLQRLLGTLHPNGEGQAVIGELISADLERDFFPRRVFSHPRLTEDGGGSGWSPPPVLCLLAGVILAAVLLRLVGSAVWQVAGALGRALRPLLLPLFVVIGIGAIKFGVVAAVLVSFAAVVLAWFLVARPMKEEAKKVLPQGESLGRRLRRDLSLVLPLAVAIWLAGWLIVDLSEYFEAVKNVTAILVTISLALWALALLFRLLSFATSWLRFFIFAVVLIALVWLAVSLGILPGDPGAQNSIPAIILGVAAVLLFVDALLTTLPKGSLRGWKERLQKTLMDKAAGRASTRGSAAALAASLVLLGAIALGLLESEERGKPLQPPEGAAVEAKRPAGAPGAGAAELNRRYAPVLVFTKNERWRPIRVNSYLRAATLYGPEGAIEKGPTLNDLPHTCPGGRSACYHLSIECESGTETCAKGRVHPHDPEKVYREGAVYVRGPLSAEDQPSLFPEQGPFQGQLRTLIQYWYFYYYDEWKAPVFAGLLTQKHESDWEVVTLGLDANARPLFVADSAHCGGSWRRWNEVEVSTKLPGPRVHPLIAVAEGSHANYPDPEQNRTSDPGHCAGLPEGVAAAVSYASNIRDKTEYGWAWYPPERGWVELRRGGPDPMEFPGTWGASDRTTLTNFNVHEIGQAKAGPKTPSLQPSWTNPVGTIFCGKYRSPAGMDSEELAC